MGQENIITKVNIDSTKENMTFGEWLDRGRGWWKTKVTRAVDAERLFVVDFSELVVAVGIITGIQKDIAGDTGRVCLEVQSEPDHELIGQKLNRGTSRNPVFYTRRIENKGVAKHGEGR